MVSYRQVIAAFPDGGGAYAVAKAHLGTRASLVAAASLIVDYVLNAAVGVSAGIAALTSAFPALYGGRVWLCLAALALITGLNLWGVSESAKVFTVPTLLFIVAIAAVILGGLFRTHPAVPLDHHLGPATEAVGVLLILRAFASGCSALTGVEAIANAVPEFRQPRARRAQATEVWLGILLGVMLIGLGVLIHKFHVVPQPGITVLAQLTQASLGHNFAVLRGPADHHGAARAGRQYLVRRPAGAGRPAGQGQLPAAHVRAARRPAGAPLRGDDPGPARRRPAGRGRG